MGPAYGVDSILGYQDFGTPVCNTSTLGYQDFRDHLMGCQDFRVQLTGYHHFSISAFWGKPPSCHHPTPFGRAPWARRAAGFLGPSGGILGPSGAALRDASPRQPRNPPSILPAAGAAPRGSPRLGSSRVLADSPRALRGSVGSPLTPQGAGMDACTWSP